MLSPAGIRSAVLGFLAERHDRIRDNVSAADKLLALAESALDVLNAQQTLLSARVALVSAQHDRVVASYSLLSAVGNLDATKLGLNVKRYDETAHYKQVRDKWFGLRTPDGR